MSTPSQAEGSGQEPTWRGDYSTITNSLRDSYIPTLYLARVRVERAGYPGRHILTKNSKLKRKRKYLVTLMQAVPILQVVELPGERGKGNR